MIDKLKYWSHKILPLVYDDSLSYYEVLNKMRAKINEIIDYVQENIEENIRAIIGSAFLDVSYDELTETLILYLNVEGK